MIERDWVMFGQNHLQSIGVRHVHKYGITYWSRFAHVLGRNAICYNKSVTFITIVETSWESLHSSGPLDHHLSLANELNAQRHIQV
jgi:hypothetical protein